MQHVTAHPLTVADLEPGPGPCLFPTPPRREHAFPDKQSANSLLGCAHECSKDARINVMSHDIILISKEWLTPSHAGPDDSPLSGETLVLRVRAM